jgi:hypothetical protein
MGRIRKKTVAFYEVFDAQGNRFPEALPWQEMLAQIALQSTFQREHKLWNTTHWASAYPLLDQDHFVLARSREEAPPTLDVSTGEFIDHENDVKRPWVEISIASFVPGTNKFGYVLGSQASPRVTAMAEWINLHGIFDLPISIGPAINPNVLERLNGAAEAKLLRVKLKRGQATSNTLESHGIFSAARVLSEDYGDIDIEIVINVSGRVDRHHTDERVRILDAARGVARSDFKKAVAELVNFDEQGNPESETINLLHDRLAKKMNVSVTDEEGNPVRIRSAIEAILKAIDSLQDSLS